MFLDHAFGDALRAYCSFDVIDFFKVSLDTFRLVGQMYRRRYISSSQPSLVEAASIHPFTTVRTPCGTD
jgi:hypothetical protein